MVLLTRHEESIKARFCFAFSINLLQSLNLFELLLLCTKSFMKFSSFINLENLCYSSFHSLLPLPKRIRQGLTAWILLFLFWCVVLLWLRIRSFLTESNNVMWSMYPNSHNGMIRLCCCCCGGSGLVPLELAFCIIWLHFMVCGVHCVFEVAFFW